MTTPTPVETPTPAIEETPPPTPEPATTFTQDEVDRIVRERLKRQKDQFADYDAIKERASKFDELEQQQKTELEKAQERAIELEQQAKDASARAQEALLRSAVVAEAARKNVIDPDAAFALLDRASLDLGEDGAPTNIADAMDSLLKAKPYLVGGGTGRADLGARESGGVEGQLSREDLKTMTPDQIVQADREGRLTDLKKG